MCRQRRNGPQAPAPTLVYRRPQTYAASNGMSSMLEAQSNNRAVIADGVPKNYTGWQFFEVPSLHSGRGGQMFVCDTQKDCDAIYKALTQPRLYIGYVYQSPTGRVVVQLDGMVDCAQATKYEAVVKQLP